MLEITILVLCIWMILSVIRLTFMFGRKNFTTKIKWYDYILTAPVFAILWIMDRF